VIVKETSAFAAWALASDPPTIQLFELNEPPVPSPSGPFRCQVEIATAAAPGVVVAGSVVKPAGEPEPALPVHVVGTMAVCADNSSGKNCVDKKTAKRDRRMIVFLRNIRNIEEGIYPANVVNRCYLQRICILTEHKEIVTGKTDFKACKSPHFSGRGSIKKMKRRQTDTSSLNSLSYPIVQ